VIFKTPQHPLPSILFRLVDERVVWALVSWEGCWPMTVSFPKKVGQLKQKGWRRRFPRHRVDFPLKASALRDEGYAEIQGRCGDIGQGGMGTVLTAEVPQGEVVSLEFRLAASSLPFAIRAIVRYQKGFVHGLEFLGLSSEQQSAINTFCAGLEPLD
jgi:PilZ domain